MAISFLQRIKRAVVGRSRVDDETLDLMEEALVESDMGVDTTLKIIDSLQDRVASDKYMSFDELVGILRDEISRLIDDDAVPFDFSKKPYVMLVVGVNGVGKTTTIGKLASMLRSQGKKVVLGAADTFRAAAVDQLTIWAERAGADIVKQAMGSDPASVAFDTVKAAVARQADVAIIDTAGRLHNRIDLMNELTKIRNVIRKVVPDGPHDVMLILDASTGQNAFQQAKEFSRATDVTSLTITKLDGTAKGGVVVGVSDQFHIPVKFIGTGEGIGDLEVFNKSDFVQKLFSADDLR
ncbi:MAG TPA: signal recognition particle-docking protein FtsY [Candidatus Cryptobacteroides pullicola]|nr:signal recognition particle-docking protein FtsY [Candidatus Cryptobacteroides pullicola]